MTALADRATKARKADSRPQGSGMPQVNLLPPEVHASRALSKTKHRLVYVVVGAVVVIVGGYGYGVFDTMTAQSQLTAAQDDARSLQTKVNAYAEVPQVLNQASEVNKARTSAMADDVVWKSYLDAITAVLPAGVSIDSLTITGPDSQTASGGTTSTSPLDPTGVGTVAFSARSATVPDAAAWVDALSSVPGLSGATVSSVSVAADEGAAPYYTVTMQASLTSAVLSHRFDATTGK